MYFLALAADYDGTIAHDGIVDDTTYDALKDLKNSGRRLLLVTGREVEDLQQAFPRYGIFDLIVAENGALIYDPATHREQLLATPPPGIFAETLKTKGVRPLTAGRCIVATREPYGTIVLETIRDLGLELQIILNKGATMVLPAGVNKATGFLAALKELGLSPQHAVGVGDAENDIAFMNACGCSAAVANALPSVKAVADVVLEGKRGAGVAELAARIIREDAKLLPPDRRAIPAGAALDQA